MSREIEFRNKICKLMVFWNFNNLYLGSRRSDFNNFSFILIVNHCSFKWVKAWLILRIFFIFRHSLYYFAILDHCGIVCKCLVSPSIHRVLRTFFISPEIIGPFQSFYWFAFLLCLLQVQVLFCLSAQENVIKKY